MKITFTFLLFLLSFFAFSQVNNALLPKQLVIYDKLFFDTIPEYLLENPYFKLRSSLYTKFENSKEVDVNDLFVKKLTEGLIEVSSEYSFYNFKGKFGSGSDITNTAVVLTPAEIKSRLGYAVDTVYIYDENTDETKIETFIHEIDKNSIMGFVFYDEWVFDDQNFKMYKIVKAYSPVRTFYRTDDWGGDPDPQYQLIGYIIQPELINAKEKTGLEKRMKLFKKTEYEFMLVNPDINVINNEFSDSFAEFCENENSPFWNSYTRTKLRNSLMERVLSGKSVAYDDETNSKLSLEEIRIRTGERTDTFIVENVEYPGTFDNVLVKNDIQILLNQIKSVIFIEEWYIDELTLSFKKVVKGIIPVRWYYQEDDYEMLNPIKMKLFKVYFNQ